MYATNDPAASSEAPAAVTDLTQPAETCRIETGELLRRARAGDRPALSQIVERLTPLVWSIARTQGLDNESAADVVQDTWITFLKNMQHIRSPDALPGWLVTVSRRHAQRMLIVAHRVQLVEPHRLADHADPVAGIDTDFATRERYRCLWDNLQKLPTTCQELLRILSFTDHTSYRTVMEALDMPKGSIGPTRRRCLNKLRVLLQNDPRWSS
jgi:RNA polymerase sigma factor (sigma-70 family)